MKSVILLSLLIISLFATQEIIPKELPKIITEAIQPQNIATDSEDFTLWSALFGLGVVALIALFLSSEQLNNFKKSIQRKRKIDEKITEVQSQILSDMGENIQNMIKEASSNANKVAQQTGTKGIENIIESENQILSITTNLIEFLRIKSKKIKIVNEEFILSNLLNDISGLLQNNTDNYKCTLIYNVKSNVAERLYGDTLNLSKIITNLILYFIEHDAKEISLNIARNSIFSKDENLYFTLRSDYKTKLEDETSIFTANYNEKSKKYESLGIFIAKELSNLMNGELIARNDKENNVEFLFQIPYKAIKTKKEKDLVEKKILIIDESYKTSQAIKELLTSLGQKSSILKKKDFLRKTPSYLDYDIVIISQNLLTQEVLHSIEKSNKTLILTKDLLDGEFKDLHTNKNIYKILKPLTRSNLGQLLKKISSSSNHQEKENVQIEEKSTKSPEPQTHKPEKKQEIKKTPTLPVYKGAFNENLSIDLESFAAFRNTKILLVEDNVINQKVFAGMLSKSGAHIEFANHGQEALDMLDMKNCNYDIIFMDINMPVMDGYRCSVEIRKIPLYDSVAIVALSALTSPSEIEKMFESKMNAYLAKPLKKETLYSALEMFLQVKKERRTTSRELSRKKLQEEFRIESINLEYGLKQTGNDTVFYKEVLKEFKDAYAGSDETFETLVKDYRYEQLRLLALDVRGMASSIGAYKLYELTTDIHQRILYKKYELIPTFVSTYRIELQKVLKDIDNYLKNY